MGFRGQPFAFESPAAAVAGMTARLRGDPRTHGPELVALHTAPGRILARAVLADRDSPPFDHAAMDGYAVRTADVQVAVRSAGAHVNTPLVFTVVDEATIGRAPPALPVVNAVPGMESASRPSIRIATGAPIPPGADAILKREDAVEIADGPRVSAFSTSLQVAQTIRAGDHVRRRGENARAGHAVLDAGTVISLAAMGTLAAVGNARALVHRRLRVALITTGDEVVPPQATPTDFQIRNSNAPALAAMLASQAWLDLVTPTAGRSAHASDDPEALDAILRDSLANAEAVIITGGVSMGHRDPVLAAISATGAHTVFHGLPQRPGKPMLAAFLESPAGTQPIFGLPGNPVSAMVTCARIVLPVLAALAGAAGASDDRQPVTLPASLRPRLVRLANADRQSRGLWWHRLVRLTEAGEVHLLDGRGSGDIMAAGRSDGFVEVAPTRAASSVQDPASATLPSDGPAPTLVPFYAWPT